MSADIDTPAEQDNAPEPAVTDEASAQNTNPQDAREAGLPAEADTTAEEVSAETLAPNSIEQDKNLVAQAGPGTEEPPYPQRPPYKTAAGHLRAAFEQSETVRAEQLALREAYLAGDHDPDTSAYDAAVEDALKELGLR